MSTITRSQVDARVEEASYSVQCDVFDRVSRGLQTGFAVLDEDDCPLSPRQKEELLSDVFASLDGLKGTVADELERTFRDGTADA